MIKHLKLIKKLIKKKVTIKNIWNSLILRLKIILLIYGIGLFVGIPLIWYVIFYITTGKTSIYLFRKELIAFLLLCKREWIKDAGESLTQQAYTQYGHILALIPIIGTSCLILLWLYLLNKWWKQYWILYEQEYGKKN